jgi:hypothetical protein
MAAFCEGIYVSFVRPEFLFRDDNVQTWLGGISL